VKDAVELLNGAFCDDPAAMGALIEARVPCNKELAHHPSIQVSAEEDGSNCRVGLLGILNGLFGVRDDGRGHIEAVFDDSGATFAGFRVGPAEDCAHG
jgi:hypothetical protein